MLAAYKNLVWNVVNLVNAPRGRTYHQQRDRLWLKGEQRRQFVATAGQIVADGLALAALGELSLRLSATQLAVTAPHCQLGQLTEADLVTCSIQSDKPLATAAPHLPWHRLIYGQTPAQAVLLGHPPYAITLANAGQVPDSALLPEMGAIIGGVTRLPPAEISPAALAETAPRHHVILLPHVGALIWGDSLADVLVRAQTVEYLSRLTVLTGRMG